MDTSKDYRILLAEDALRRLDKRVRSWSLSYPIHKNRVLDLLREANGHLQAIKHSYLPIQYLLKYEPLSKLTEVARKLSAELLPPKGVRVEGRSRFLLAEIKYSLLQLLNLRARLALGEENLPENAVDIVAVEVVSVMRHPEAERLYVTKAGTEKFGLTIVTNILNIKKGEVRAAAILPPQEFFGVVSEAMYCSDPLPREMLGRRPPRNAIHVPEVTRVVEAIVRGGR